MLRQRPIYLRITMLGLAFAASTFLIISSVNNAAPTASLEKVDITNVVLTDRSGDCADYSASYQASVTDVNRNLPFLSEFVVSGDGNSCSVYSNDIPNYDFNDESAKFASPVATQELTVTIPRNPNLADEPTSLNKWTYNAIMLNGVFLDQLSDGCYKPSAESADPDGNVAAGCGLSSNWDLNPMGKVKFGTDSHNAHTQPGGLYHYHGNPLALFDPEETDQGSPVIGFAADGFPIYGPHYLDSATGQMLTAKSGYTLKSGSRPETEGSPGGTYDGTYVQDYEFTKAGTLDECNGMTVDGQYGYYVTNDYPYVMGCYSGSPDKSFFKFWNIAKWIAIGVIVALTLFTLLGVFIYRKIRARKFAKLKSENLND